MRITLPLRTKNATRRFVSCISALLLLVPAFTGAGWVDPDSPKDALSTQALTKGDDRQYELVRLEDVNRPVGNEDTKVKI